MATSATKRLRLGRILGAGEHFHLARCDYTPGAAVARHRHDFTELFWVISGRGSHRVNGTFQRLTVGTLVLMRPDDVHTLFAGAGERFAIYNLVFDNEAAGFIHARYFDGGDWPWRGGATPGTYLLDAASLGWLNDEADRLSRAARTRLAVEGFLIRLMERLSEQGRAEGRRRPPWLSRALRGMDEPAALREGPAALARLAGRSQEHLNRVVQHHFGCTTTALVNDLRLTRAARLLRMTDQPIPDIAVVSGYDNLSYFYRRFRRRFETTPRRYRRQAQSVAR